MERLTFEGNFCDIAQCHNPDGTDICEEGRCSLRDTWDRLKSIEDILGDEYDLDLVQKLIQAYREGRYIILKEPEQAGISRLRELAQADREGRCVVLPCKAGETVYLITSPENVPGIDLEDLTDDECENHRIFECEVSSTTIWDNGKYIRARLHFNGQFVAHYITPEDFGKVVFLTRADAEAALRGEQDEQIKP